MRRRHVEHHYQELIASLYDGGGVPAEHAPRGLAGVTLWQRDGAPTAALLVAEFGFVVVGHEHGRLRVMAKGAAPAA